MIPLRDSARTTKFPLAVILIIGLNGLAYLWELRLGSRLDDFIQVWGFVPARQSAYNAYAVGRIGEWGPPWLTTLFLHGGWVHILGNMLFLWVFGDNMEEAFGTIRFAGFYLLSGCMASIAQFLANRDTVLPMIGASGAVAGVLGAYMNLMPRARILTFIPIFIFPWFIELPAFLLLGIWFLQQLLSSTLAISEVSGQAGGVAWWAHIGGFVTGFILARPLRRLRPPPARRVIAQRWR